MQEKNLVMPALSTRNATSNRNWNINLFILDFSPMEEDLLILGIVKNMYLHCLNDGKLTCISYILRTAILLYS